MEHLQAQLQELLNQLPDAEAIRARLEDLISVYPFNEYEFIISHLLAANVLGLDAYYELRDDYLARNMFLYIFEISAPRTFGESWAQGHLKELIPDLQKPSKKRDPDYSGQYDFLLDAIRLEVKASRAVDADLDAPLYVKALASDSQKSFWMNFQQIKPACCDVFVWIAVWRDTIRYWVQSSYEVENNRHYSRGQHRGNVGEGQLHLRPDNFRDFDQFLIQSNALRKAIVGAYTREVFQRSRGNAQA
ncbi:MAG: hypothetical protein NTY19_42685 [Planctomycetota bacterium]|nr:hypothetical protein [Planctomycetota bacterium]